MTKLTGQALFDALTRVQQEVLEQIPHSANRIEELETAPKGMDNEVVYQLYLNHQTEFKKSAFEHFIFKHLNQFFPTLLLETGCINKSTLSQEDCQLLKARVLDEATTLAYKAIHSMDKDYQAVYIEITSYLNTHLDELVQALWHKKKLTLKNKQHQELLDRAHSLAAHRDLIKSQFKTNCLSLFRGETKEELIRIDILYRGDYLSRTNCFIANCGEYAALTLIKLFEHELIPQLQSVEYVEITYHDEDGKKDDGHAFIVINRDRNSTLNKMETWGEDAVLMDPWNKLLCWATKLNLEPLHYYSFPEWETWSAIRYKARDINHINKLRNYMDALTITGCDDIDYRTPLLEQEYQLTALTPSSHPKIHHIITELVKALAIDNLNFPVNFYLTTGGDELVTPVYGFRQASIAIHVEFLQHMHAAGNYEVGELTFGLCRALVVLKQWGSMMASAWQTYTEQTQLDRLTLEITKQPEAAVAYLEKSITFQKAKESVYRFQLLEPEALFNLTPANAVKLSAFPERIKNIYALIAVNLSLREPTPKIYLPEAAISELKPCQSVELFKDGFEQAASIPDKLAYLGSQLTELKKEILPYELTRKMDLRLSQFCQLLASLAIDYENRYHVHAVNALINQAYQERIPGFERIYWACFQYYSQAHALHCGFNDFSLVKSQHYKYLYPLGPFKQLQDLIEQFIYAKDLAAVVQAIENFNALYKKLESFLCHFSGLEASGFIKKYKKAHQGQTPTGEDRFFSGDLVRYFRWRNFSNGWQDNSVPWQKFIDLMAVTGPETAKLIGRMLWCLGVNYDPNVVQFFQKEDLDWLINNDHPKAIGYIFCLQDEQLKKYSAWGYVDVEKIVGYFSHRHQVDDSMLWHGADIAENIKAFVQKNLVALANPQFKESRQEGFNNDTASVHALLDFFARTIEQGNDHEKAVIKQFFLDSNKENTNFLTILRGYRFYTQPLGSSTHYARFIIDQTYKGCHFNLFDSYNLDTLVANGVISSSSIPWMRIIKGFGLAYDKLDYACLLELLPLITKTKGLGNRNADLLQEFFAVNGKQELFSQNAVMLLIELYSHYKMYLNGTFIENNFTWPKNLFNACMPLTLSTLTQLYQILEGHFPSLAESRIFTGVIRYKLEEINDVAEKQQALEALLFMHQWLNNPINDIAFRDRLVQDWVECVVQLHGQDDTSTEYAARLKSIINKVEQQAHIRDVEFILNQLADGIVSQGELTTFIGKILEPEEYLLSNNFSTDKSLTGMASFARFLATFKQADTEFIKFLSTPLSPKSLSEFRIFLTCHTNFERIMTLLGCTSYDRGAQETQLEMLYHHFWRLNLKQRAIIMDYILVPPDKVITAEARTKTYNDNVKLIINKLFPNQNDNSSDEALAAALASAYLETADPYIRSYLLAGMLVVSKENDTSTRIGQKLASFGESMGPAYVKLLQTIHSHPDTPTEISHDLAHVKGHANPPTRPQLMRLIDKVLPPEMLNQIKRIGCLLGSASFNLALEVELNDGSLKVLLLLRDKALKDSEDGFKHLKATLVACEHARLVPMKETILSMIDEAHHLSRLEMDHESGDIQNQLAKEYYKQTFTIKDNDQTFKIVIDAADSLNSGHGYRLLDKVEGIEFNHLPANTPKEKQLIKIVAKAMVLVELEMILSGREFDCDRHGNQLRIHRQGNTLFIGLYDFGEMALHKPTREELKQLINLINSLPDIINSDKTVMTLFADHINQAIANKQSCEYLMRVRKGLLALHDFYQHLDKPDFHDILMGLYQRDKIHPSLNTAFVRCSMKFDVAYTVLKTVNELKATAYSVKELFSRFSFMSTWNNLKKPMCVSESDKRVSQGLDKKTP